MRFLLTLLLISALAGLTVGQQPSPESPVAAMKGFHQVQGKHIEIITDVPLDDELRDLPRAFDAAMQTWCKVFAVERDDVEDWHCTACIMLDRPRFEAAGLIPEQVQKFSHGYQYGDQLWVTEQPGAYYRRHLLLHEGTHWFMTRKFGSNGPPWLMEGLAEWLATHTWDSETQKLAMGIVPRSKEDVPYWGRIAIIQEQLAVGLAPSLETIMRYSNTAHQQVDAYAWSWALVVFLHNHPRTQATFSDLLNRPMRDDFTMTRWLFRELRTQWSRVRQEWNAMLTDMDYGYDPKMGMLQISNQPQSLSNSPTQYTVQANQSWQASGILVQAGDRFAVKADGEFIIGTEPAPWRCFPNGVTLEYYRGEPLGKLLMTIVAPINDEPDFSVPIHVQAVGEAASLAAPQTGELHFRINESSARLSDNSGQLQIELSVQKP